MHIRFTFHSEEELAQKLGQHFVMQWRRLVAEYNRLKHLSMDQAYALRIASLSFAFCGAATNGDSQTVAMWDDMLHGQCADYVEMDGQRLLMEEDDPGALLMWDTAALIMNEQSYQLQAPQSAYDVVGRHVYLAYKLPEVVVEEATVAQEPRVTQSARPAAAEEQQVDLVAGLVKQMMQCGKREDAERMELMVRRSLGSRMSPQQQRQLDSVQTYYQEREQMLVSALQKSPSSLIRQLVLRQFNLGEDATMDELMKMI